MPATALIVFDQGGPGTAGEAFEGSTGSLVTVTNDDNTDVTSWTITLTDVPPDSALVPGVLGTAVDNTPTASFTPDVAGSFRILLEVSDGVTPDTDIRNFGIRNTRGFIFPSYGLLPDPKPVTGSGLPGSKPNEYNFGGQTRGWSGDRASGLLEEFMTKYDDLPSTVVTAGPYAAPTDTTPLTVVDSDTVGAPLTFTLPSAPRANLIHRILVAGSDPTNLVTVQAAGGGTILDYTTVLLAPPGGSATFISQGSNNWRVLGLSSGSNAPVMVPTTVTTSVGPTELGGMYVVLVDTSDVGWNNLDAITLPASATAGSRVVVKDSGGNASVKAITVDGNGNNIDGGGSMVISTNYGSLTLISIDGTNWAII